MYFICCIIALNAHMMNEINNQINVPYIHICVFIIVIVIVIIIVMVMYNKKGNKSAKKTDIKERD